MSTRNKGGATLSYSADDLAGAIARVLAAGAEPTPTEVTAVLKSHYGVKTTPATTSLKREIEACIERMNAMEEKRLRDTLPLEVREEIEAEHAAALESKLTSAGRQYQTIRRANEPEIAKLQADIAARDAQIIALNRESDAHEMELAAREAALECEKKKGERLEKDLSRLGKANDKLTARVEALTSTMQMMLAHGPAANDTQMVSPVRPAVSGE